MGLIRILLKEFYINHNFSKGFKGYEYFKRVLSSKGAKWIASQIEDNLDDPYIMKKFKQEMITGYGTQYLRFYYKGKENKNLILRLSNYKEDRSISENAHYIIDIWNSTEREIKEHINHFIDIAVVYFNALNKKDEGEQLSTTEEKIIRQVQFGDPFHKPDSYVSLDVVNRKALKKKKHGSRTPELKLP